MVIQTLLYSGLPVVHHGVLLASSSGSGCPSGPLEGIQNPGKSISCSAADTMTNLVNFILARIVDFIKWVEDPDHVGKIFSPAVSGDLTGLCQAVDPKAADDCDGQSYANTLAPYAEVLGISCWGWSVLRSLHEPGQTDLSELLQHVKRGLVMMAGIWLAYPAARFVWEVCRVASNAMVFDVTGGHGLTAPQVNTGLQSQAEVVGFGIVGLGEMLFLAVWMVAATVGVLIGSIFGSFAVAVSPASGTQGLLGRWLQFMSGFYLLRLLLPPISAVLVGIMGYFTNHASGSNGADLAVTGFANLVVAVALLWVSGKAVQFLAQGVAGAGATMGGMLSIGQRYQGAAGAAAGGGYRYAGTVAGRVADRAASRSRRYVGVKQKVQSATRAVGSIVKP